MTRLLRSPKCPIPTPMIPMDHPQEPQVVNLVQAIDAALAEPLKPTNAKLLALERDGYCCVITGSLDDDSVERGYIHTTHDTVTVYTQVANIFGECNGENILGEDHAVKREWVSTAAAMVERYAEISIRTELNGSNIHRASNVLTLEEAVHLHFDALKISLEPIQDLPHAYIIHTWPEGRHHRYRLPRQVAFTDHSNGKTEMPDRRYLELHYICAKVLHLSGAREIVETYEREMEELDVLATDGSSAKYLSEALSGALPWSTTVH